MNISTSAKSFAAAIAILGANLATLNPADAQQAVTSAAPATSAPDETGGLQEIIVTSQKRAERLQDVPISVTAISGQEIADANIRAQIALSALTPNLVVNFNSNYVAPYIRGIGTQYANAGLDPSVALYLDDQYFPRADGGLFDLADVQRVEVLKGPQGTLYGRNTVGGAIRIITNEASQDLYAKADVTVGNLGRLGSDLVLNGGITSTLSGRVSFDYDSDDGFVHNTNPGYYPNIAARHQYTILSKLLWEPTDRFTMHVRFGLQDKKDTEGAAFLPITNVAPTQIGIVLGGIPSPCFYCTTSQFYNSAAEKSHDDSTTGTIRADYRFDGVTFSSISSWIHVAGHDFADLSTVSYNVPVTGGAPVGSAGLIGEVAESPIQTTNTYTQEFQFVSDLTGPFKYTTGLYALHAREEYYFAVAGSLVGIGVSPPTWLGGDGISTTDSIALYGEGTYSITDKLDFTAGGRFTNETKDLVTNDLIVSTGSYTGPNLDTAPAQHLDGGESIVYRRFTPKGTLTYRPWEKTMFYGTFSRGFKSGGFNLPAFTAVDEVKPESVSAFELGWKTEFSRVRFNGALFYDNQTNLQVQLTDQKSGGTHVVNAGKTKIYGAETDIDWAATDALTLTVGGGLLHARYSEFTGDAYRPCNGTLSNPTPAQLAQFTTTCAAQGGLGFTLVSGNNFAGAPTSLAPDFTGYVRASYLLPIPSAWGSLNAVAMANYMGEYTYNPEQTLLEPSKTLFNANLAWNSADKHYRATIFGTNLGNKEYTTTKTFQGTGGWYVPGRPREYGLTLGYNFK